VPWNAGRRVQRDRRPNRVDIRLRDAVAAQEIAGCVRAVDLEALLSAAVLWGKAQVMEHRSGIQKLRIEAQVPVLSGQCTEIINPARVMEEKRRCRIADQFGYSRASLLSGRLTPCTVDVIGISCQCGGQNIRSSLGCLQLLFNGFFCQIQSQADVECTMKAARVIAIVAMPGVQLLDVSGPLDVFAEANVQARKDVYRLVIVAKTAGHIRSSSGARLVPDLAIGDAMEAKIDTLLVAGCPNAADVRPDAAVVEWLRRIAPQARRYGSICSAPSFWLQPG